MTILDRIRQALAPVQMGVTAFHKELDRIKSAHDLLGVERDGLVTMRQCPADVQRGAWAAVTAHAATVRARVSTDLLDAVTGTVDASGPAVTIRPPVGIEMAGGLSALDLLALIDPERLVAGLVALAPEGPSFRDRIARIGEIDAEREPLEQEHAALVDYGATLVPPIPAQHLEAVKTRRFFATQRAEREARDRAAREAEAQRARDRRS